MPFIQDEPRSFAAQPPPPQTQVNYLNSTVVVFPVGYAISTAATCSCARDANGTLAHVCTAASYTRQAVVAPRQDSATQNTYLMGMGGQFNGN